MDNYYSMLLIALINLINCQMDYNQTSDKINGEQPFDFDQYSDGLDKLFESIRKKQGNLLTENFQNLFNKNPDLKRSTCELIVSRGFQCESHTVVTDDGYILGIFRIINPYYNYTSKPKPVLLWHQFSTTSSLWLFPNPGTLDNTGYYSELNGTVPNNCGNKLTSNVAFTLAACGYDVWLGNSRGNIYSNGHIQYSFYSKAYWNYTFTEEGLYDARNTIEFILKKTKSNCLGYYGSSQGSTQMWALLSLMPNFERWVRPIIFGPSVTFLGHTTSILRYFTVLVPFLNNLVFGFGSPQFLIEAIAQVCSNSLIQPICQKFILSLAGNVPSYLTAANAVINYIAVAGNYLSSKLILQYGQFILDGRFHQFDYLNPKDNYAVYGTAFAPDYPLEMITSRNLVIFRGANDPFCVKKDLDILLSKLTVPPLDVYVIKNPSYNHIDFISATKNNYYTIPRILAHLDNTL